MIESEKIVKKTSAVQEENAIIVKDRKGRFARCKLWISAQVPVWTAVELVNGRSSFENAL